MLNFAGRLIQLSITLVLLNIFSLTHAASFPCNKASTWVEKYICQQEPLSQADDKLGDLYRETRRLLPPSQQSVLQRTQQQWLTLRNQCQTSVCLAAQYQQRIQQLSREYHAAQHPDKALNVLYTAEQTRDNSAALVVHFSQKLAIGSQWRQALSLTSGSQTLSNENWVLAEDSKQIYYPFIDSDTTYDLTIQTSLMAEDGTPLTRLYQHQITSRASEPYAEMASQGNVLSLGMKMALPIVTLDIDEVDLAFHYIAPEKIAQWSRYSTEQHHYYYGLNQFATDNPLVHSARFAIPNRPHQRTITNLDLSDIEALQKPGAYLAVMRIPGQYSYDFATSFFTVSDIGLQVRKNQQSIIIYSHSIESGKSRSGVAIEVLDDEGKTLAAGVTSPAGDLRLSGQSISGKTVIAHTGAEYTVLRIDQPPLDMSTLPNVTSRHQAMQFYAWQPRDLYRPGEEILIQGLLTDHDGQSVAAIPVEATLYDATGSRILRRVLQKEDSGIYPFQFALSSQAKTGKWRLTYRIPGQDRLLHETHFQVEDFLPERLELLLGEQESLYSPLPLSDTYSLPVQGNYLYGAPAAGNKLDGVLFAERDPHPFLQWKTYHFGLHDEAIPNPVRELPETTLDASGQRLLDLDLTTWNQVRSPLALTASVSLYESGGRAVTRKFTQTLLGTDHWVGIQPDFVDAPDNDSQVNFKLILVDKSGQPITGNRYRVRLVHEDRNYYWAYNTSSGWHWQYDAFEYAESDSSVDFTEERPTEIRVPVKWGRYRLEIYDPQNTLVNRYAFETRWGGWETQSATSLQPDQILMHWDKANYEPGETARLSFKSAIGGVANLTLEHNDEVLWRQQRLITGEETTLDIPLDQDWNRHDIYLTATVLAPGDMTHSVAPKRAFGLMHLPIQRQDAALQASLSVPEQFEPGQTITAKIRVSGVNRRQSPTFVTLAAVDVGVLNLTNFSSPDPLGYLFGARRYDFSLYDVYDRIIENAGYPYVQQRFGGGLAQTEAELARGGKPPVDDSPILSIQTTPIALSANGEANIALDIPEFSGRIRWMLVAWNDRSYGRAEQESLVREKVVVQLSKPRFLAPGDESQLTLDVHNQSGLSQSLTATLTLDGVTSHKQTFPAFTLADGERHLLSLPISAAQSGQMAIQLTLQNDEQADEPIRQQKNWSLLIRDAFPSVTRQQQVQLAAGQTWTLKAEYDDLRDEGLQAQLRLSRTPVIDLRRQLEALLQYPYGCTEQSISRAIPWLQVSPEQAEELELTEAIQTSLGQPYDSALRRTYIEKVVQRVLERQLPSGGVGLWSNKSPEDGWLTAYAGEFLLAVHTMGIEVPANNLEQLLRRLDQYLRGDNLPVSAWSENREFSLFATQSYAAYVLARANRAWLSDVRRLLESNLNHPWPSPLPWAYLSQSLHILGAENDAEQARTLAFSTPYQGGYFGHYGSLIRDMALSYVLLSEQGPSEANAMLQQVLTQSHQKTWFSTQERNALFQVAWLTHSENRNQVQAVIDLGGKTQQVDHIGSVRLALSASQLHQLQQINAPHSPLFADLTVIGSSRVAPTQESHQIAIEREYFDLHGQATPLNQLQSGDLVVARLAVKSEYRMPDALLVDLIPAGLELENPNLIGNTVQLEQLLIEGKPLGDTSLTLHHQEFRHDRYLAAATLQAQHTHYLYYLLRAVTPGRYLVPPPYVEDMYQPEHFAIGQTPPSMEVLP